MVDLDPANRNREYESYMMDLALANADSDLLPYPMRIESLVHAADYAVWASSHPLDWTNPECRHGTTGQCEYCDGNGRDADGVWYEG